MGERNQHLKKDKRPKAAQLFAAGVKKAALEKVVFSQGHGFFDGGCLVFAKAVCQIYPEAKVVSIHRNGKADHYGVFIPQIGYGDFDGFFPLAEQWLSSFRETVPRIGAFGFCGEFVPSDDIEAPVDVVNGIASTLSGGAKMLRRGVVVRGPVPEGELGKPPSSLGRTGK